MAYGKKVKFVTITDSEAVELINIKAIAENRTAANAASIVIKAALQRNYIPNPNKEQGKN